MKIILIISVVVAIIIIGLASVYFSANNSVRETYLKSYNDCLARVETNPYYIDEYRAQIPDEGLQIVDSCINSGGCFDTCASACDPETPYIGFFESLSYFSPKACIAMCIPRCFYPIDYFS